ncbi:hypothetical protein JZ751_014517, partial [Albula glossodonta]
VQTPRAGRWRQGPSPLNMNHYANKKSAAESMLDIALLMANASQLKAVLEQGPDFTFYTTLVSLISISIILQVIVGILLIFIDPHCCRLTRERIWGSQRWRKYGSLRPWPQTKAKKQQQQQKQKGTKFIFIQRWDHSNRVAFVPRKGPHQSHRVYSLMWFTDT